MSRFEDKVNDFKALGAEVFAISADSEHSHKPFEQELGLDYQLLSDFNREFAKQWDLLANVGPYQNVLKRSAWLISKGDGVIRYAAVSDDPRTLPDPEPVLEELRRLAG